MIYTGYSGKDYKICLATSRNLIGWKRQGIMLDELNKNASLLTEQGWFMIYYYGGADSVIGVAELKKEEMLFSNQ